MKGSDIILASIQNDEIILRDMFAPTNNEQPRLDLQQDLKLIYGYQNDTHTVVAFERFVYEKKNSTLLVYKYDNCVFSFT